MCWVLFPIKKYEKNYDQEFMLTLFLLRYFFLIATGIKIDEQTLKRRGKKKDARGVKAIGLGMFRSSLQGSSPCWKIIA